MYDNIYDSIENGEIGQALESIRTGLLKSPCDYELFFLLSLCYEYLNPNQAYLCCINSLYLCTEESDVPAIRQRIEYLKCNYTLSVTSTNIVIVSYNCFEMLKKCIESVRSSLPPESYQLIIIDNNSESEVVNWLHNQSDILLQCNPQNVGFAEACNQGYRLAYLKGLKDNDIFLLNNDAILSPNSLFWLKMGLYENESIGAVGSISNRAGNRQNIDIEYDNISDYLNFGNQNNVFLYNPYEERIRLSGFSLLVKSSVWCKTEGMDPQFSPGYFEDDDLSMKIRKEGYTLNVCKNSFVFHAGSQSFSKVSNYEEIILSNYQKFIDKYGFSLVDYSDPMENLFLYLPTDRDSYFSYLEIGCNLGANVQTICENYPNSNALGIEENSVFYALSMNHNNIFCSVDSLMKSCTTTFDFISINKDIYTDVVVILQMLISHISPSTRIYMFSQGRITDEVTIN